MIDVEKELSAAIASGNAKKVGEICDYLRFTRKLNYAAQIQMVTELGCNPDDYEELLYEADRLSSER